MRNLKRILAVPFAIGLVVALALPSAARNPNGQNTYAVHNLVSDVPGAAEHVDPLLVNSWGIAASSTSPWWVADNETDASTLYGGAGNKIPLEVSVPGGPTGIVFNGSGDFVVTNGDVSGPARFIFATEAGTILGWNPTADPTHAITAATVEGANYKGLAIGSSSVGNVLYAADFHNAAVQVFDSTFDPVELDGDFTDSGIPDGFAPFGIQDLGGVIYVAYAMQDDEAEDEIAGPGLGYVSAFDLDGHFLGRVASGGELNAPWGLAWAPSGFGKFSGDLLVGNFGDGRINGFAMTEDGWESRGPMKGTDHRPIVIDGLWGIGFGNGAGSGSATSLYFAAGPDDEEHGLFGSVTPPES
jgi:uncharacterized protein (TIGR03118 family)